MGEKVKKLGIERKGRMLYVDGSGDVSEVDRKTKNKKKVKSAGITREPGYLYYVDKQGDISRAKMKKR